MKEKIYYLQDAIGRGHSVPESKLEEFRKMNEDIKKDPDKYRQIYLDIVRKSAARYRQSQTGSEATEESCQ